jgi:hypothetical protein
MSLRDKLSGCWSYINDELFPWLHERMEPLTKAHKEVVTVLEVVHIDTFLPYCGSGPGRPLAGRAALARAFVAKAVLDLPTTSMLIDRVKVDKTLRRLCGWERFNEIPSEATFSRAFDEFASSKLAERVHEALIKEAYAERLVGHISRDATAIEARERPAAKPAPAAEEKQKPSKRRRGRPRKSEAKVDTSKGSVGEQSEAKQLQPEHLQAGQPEAETAMPALEPASAPAAPAGEESKQGKRRRGRPRKSEAKVEQPKIEQLQVEQLQAERLQAVQPEAKKQKRRVERQPGMSLEEMLADLPKQCDVGTKLNAKGYKTSWIGYKFHIDVADGDIPVSCVLTSASLHDSQAAIPLATMTAKRVTSLYDLMDAAYDDEEISKHSRSLGHVPIIDVNPRNNATQKEELANEAKARRRLDFQFPEDVRYNQRSSSERVNGHLKDNHGGSTVRVRGHDKVYSHLMFGIVAITVEQMMRFVT